MLIRATRREFVEEWSLRAACDVTLVLSVKVCVRLNELRAVGEGVPRWALWVYRGARWGWADTNGVRGRMHMRLRLCKCARGTYRASACVHKG